MIMKNWRCFQTSVTLYTAFKIQTYVYLYIHHTYLYLNEYLYIHNISYLSEFWIDIQKT